ncbi:ATP/GTP-binding protein [Streptomyces sp. A3M-1-3]|uniref:ATP/GTP-binding protein n=1 Tax=Streptomyces sp. A3M-1-3 TaxID=2962044 RepID=UPI0020B7D410|nr:ATP/GTP-binding protein [Streptomyces sp. A3M-1-3]MCP3816652.1 ATP/GTP-binding protein [Streptomyces sp. A3M-1-3]
MDTEGTYDARGTQAGQVPRPAGPPPMPALPPATGPSLTEWLRTPRPEAEPGVWRYGHRPGAPEEAAEAPDRALLSGAVISILACTLVWSLLRNGYIPYWTVPLKLFTPQDWWEPLSGDAVRRKGGETALPLYELLFTGALLYGFGRLGNWRSAFDRLIAARGPWVRAGAAAVGAMLVMLLVSNLMVPVRPVVYSLLPYGSDREANRALVDVADAAIYLAVVLVFAWLGGLIGLLGRMRRLSGPQKERQQAPPAQPGGENDPVAWPQLRAAGLGEAADRLAAEIAGGRMNDVDHARIRRAWQSVQADPSRLDAFTGAVLRQGAAACTHPSGARDLPVRAARHDLLVRQVRIGSADPSERNPYPRRGTAVALDPALLGTSLLAVGPPGAGKTSHLVRPVVESLALQAIAGQAAVIAVGAVGAQLGPDEAYDVVVKLGDPASAYDLDLYGGTTDPDEAAALLAEAFIGDLPDVDSRRAATALAQLLGPYRAAYSRFPSVPELRELLDGVPTALATLREALDGGGHYSLQRELDARARQCGAPGDPGVLLADRVALLDRPAFAGFFDTGDDARPFSLRSLEHPLRVRIDLPERGHAEASRMLARLVLAQFTASAAARADRSLFACLVLDDASHTLTAETVRGIQRLRTANAGAVLTLRTLDDVPEPLRPAVLGAVGCRMAFSGVTTWDGKRFAEAWGTEWVETRDVTSRTVFADQPLTRAVHAFRKLVTGKAVTTDAITVRKVERERWSASDLAHAVPMGHAVLSLTTVRGEHAPPLLVDLRG